MKRQVMHYVVSGEVDQAWHIWIIAAAERRGWLAPIRLTTMGPSSLFAPDINSAIDFLVTNFPDEYGLAQK